MDNIDIASQVKDIVDRNVRAMLEDEGHQLKEYIQYEFGMANMELASSWRMHGYDFKMMPEAFIEHIYITPVAVDANQYSLQVEVQAESFKEEPEDKIDFFRKYVIDNAMAKMRAKLGAR